MVTSVKEDTQVIKNDTANIKQDTSQIASLAQEMGLLRLQISQLEDRRGSGGVILERFLAESTTYAESVVDTEDFDTIEFNQNATSAILEEGDGSEPESSRNSDELQEQYYVPVSQLAQSPGHASRPRMQQPVSNSPTQRPSPNRGAHLPSSSNVLPAASSTAPLQNKSLSTKPQKKSSEREPHLQLDHAAINLAQTARDKLSPSEAHRLDNQLLLLLEGNHSSLAAIPGAKKFHRDKVGTQSEVRAVLDRGANPDARTGVDRNLERPHYTALQIEIRNASRIEVVRLLLSRGADPNTTWRSGDSDNALQAAAAADNLQLFKLLIEHGADVKAERGGYGSAFGYALHTAACWGHLEMIEFLLKYRADVNARGPEYGNALLAAAFWGQLEVINLLVKHGADANVQNRFQGSALQAACASHRFKLDGVRFLLEHGADVNARGGEYGSALRAALQNMRLGNSERKAVVKLLREHGAKEG